MLLCFLGLTVNYKAVFSLFTFQARNSFSRRAFVTVEWRELWTFKGYSHCRHFSKPSSTLWHGGGGVWWRESAKTERFRGPGQTAFKSAVQLFPLFFLARARDKTWISVFPTCPPYGNTWKVGWLESGQ